MKDHKFKIGYGLIVVYRGMMDSLFQERPEEEEYEVHVDDFNHLSYLLSEKGTREVCEREGFDMEQEIRVYMRFKDSDKNGDSMFVTISDKKTTNQDKIRFTYQYTHTVDDRDINKKIAKTYNDLIQNIKRSAARDGVNLDEQN